MIEEVHRELRYYPDYPVELGEPDPWLYARYHCGTTSNWYSRVHWGQSVPVLELGEAHTEGMNQGDGLRFYVELPDRLST